MNRVDVPKCLHLDALEYSNSNGGRLAAVVLTNPELVNCPSAARECPLCAGAIRAIRTRAKGKDTGPEGANQLWMNIRSYTNVPCPH
jgi:hypothetical protein